MHYLLLREACQFHVGNRGHAHRFRAAHRRCLRVYIRGRDDFAVVVHLVRDEGCVTGIQRVDAAHHALASPLGWWRKAQSIHLDTGSSFSLSKHRRIGHVPRRWIGVLVHDPRRLTCASRHDYALKRLVLDTFERRGGRIIRHDRSFTVVRSGVVEMFPLALLGHHHLLHHLLHHHPHLLLRVRIRRVRVRVISVHACQSKETHARDRHDEKQEQLRRHRHR
mmetsp:Transcript_10029/g.22620  ORF Transcript_10029/g.22620 Transcript_10029/m.22620 type:complete len:222 (-) Transcript_10029:31-696(-)